MAEEQSANHQELEREAAQWEEGERSLSWSGEDHSTPSREESESGAVL